MSNQVPTIRPSNSAEIMLSKIRRILMRGYTGEIHLVCSQGGVRTVTLSQTLRPEDVDEEAA